MCLCVFVLLPAAARAQARVEFPRAFAPAEGMVRPEEKPFRQEVCLNGRWQFQPAAVPADYRRGEGTPPELPPPAEGAWEQTPIKIPSPWNVNAWGTGRKTGDPASPYTPGSIYYPSYPASWAGAEMGWLRREFRVPAGWGGLRVLLHFEAVAGECRVLVNGRLAGTHFDSFLPFELDVTRLLRPGANELLVGVRAPWLFDKQSRRYPKMRAPYPCGSTTDRLAGIWQDVFLLGVPPVRLENVFVKPNVDQDTLEVEATLRNDTGREQRVSVRADVRPWLNLAASDTLSAPEPRWKLGAPALSLPPAEATLAPGPPVVITLRQRAAGRLKLWAPGSPNLYMAVLAVSAGGRPLDRKSMRFGWRQFRIRGRDLLLNGQKIHLVGDFLHPFGPFVLSRRYAWAWYRLIQEMGGNCARLHAQPHPRHYLDLADEMGIVVLDETALFGSSVALNFEEPAAWQRFANHYDGLVLRDRNHPCVLGWSFGNELFAVFDLNHVSPEDADRWYGQLADLGLRARRLDPTRDWISCDGDEDLRGRLPVWSKHFGHGLPLDRLPETDKPLMVGESGGTYYARPAQLAIFNGDRAYESYAGRSEALAIDVWENLTRMARPRLAWYSASETAWFGVEHLPFGYRDFTRLPDEQDGVFFTAPYREGAPGMQPERLPPYVCTLNPGWDPALPLYKPLPMFEAERAALAKGGPLPCPWRRPARYPQPPAPAPPTVAQVALIGDAAGPLGRRLAALGVPLAGPAPAAGFTIVDADRLAGASLAEAKRALESVQAGGTSLWLMGAGAVSQEALALLPAPVRLTQRTATALVPDAAHPWTSALTLPELYFAEEGAGRTIQRFGLAGELVERGRVLLRTSDIDWSLFNDAPENAKCGALVLYEHLVKPTGAALVEYPCGKGKLYLCTVDYRVAGRRADALWRKLFAGAGVKLRAPQESALPAFEDGVLLNALGIGRFSARDVDAALATDFLAGTPEPAKGVRVGELAWAPVSCPSRDRFLFHQLGQPGPAAAFAVYFSFWLNSPRALDDLLAGGPDAPQASLLCYVSERCRLFVNGREVAPARTSPADYRTLYEFASLPLKKGWNHLLLKVASDRLQGDRPGTLAVRLVSNNRAYLQEVDSAIER